MRHNIPSPLDHNPFCSFLNKIWAEGWLDEFSENHFLIKAMNNNLDSFKGYQQLRNNNCNIHNCNNYNTLALNFLMNFSNKLDGLNNRFGNNKIELFVKNQLSAGKEKKYNEDQFFQALSEVEVLNFFSNKPVTNCVYEPVFGNSKSNPEARFYYKFYDLVDHRDENDSSISDELIVDIEVKTPGFSKKILSEPAILPCICLSDKGFKEISSYSTTNNLKCIMPRIKNLIKFLNDSAKKFEYLNSKRHLNLVYINWTYSELPQDGYLEPYSLLYNDINGLLKNKNIGIKMGLSEDVYNKITAVITYTSSLDNLLTTDFRHLWATHCFSIIPIQNNPYLVHITNMDYKKNRTAPYVMIESYALNLTEKAIHLKQGFDIMQLSKKYAKK